MSIPVSTVPAAQSAILTALQAVLATNNETAVQVTIGTAAANLADTWIEIVSEVRRTVDPHAFVGSGGAAFLEEIYDIDVIVSVARQTTNTTAQALAVSQRAWQLVAYLETAVRNDPSLGGAVVEAYPASAIGGKPAWATEGTTPGRLCTITVAVHCTAVI